MSNPHGLFVQFYTDAIEIPSLSEKEGRPIFKDVAFISKMVPGDQTNVIERVALDHDKEQFPREWEAFCRAHTEGVTGTPLEQWPPVTRSQVKEAKYHEVHTVEQMAALTDHACQRMGMGFAELRAKAVAYLEAANSTAAATAQAAENKRLSDEIEALKAQLAGTAEAPKRGRKSNKDEPETEAAE